MSGRAFARDPDGNGSGFNLEAILPHVFSIAPKCVSLRKEMAIRRAIRRRCGVEKNWRKLFSIRKSHRAKPGEDAVVETTESAASASSDLPTPMEVDQREPQGDKDEEAVAETSKQDAPESIEAPSLATPSAPAPVSAPAEPTNKKKELQERLEKLKAEMSVLADQKHLRFLQLKELLIEEAKVKKQRTGMLRQTSNSDSPRVQEPNGSMMMMTPTSLSLGASASGVSPAPVGVATPAASTPGVVAPPVPLASSQSLS